MATLLQSMLAWARLHGQWLMALFVRFGPSCVWVSSHTLCTVSSLSCSHKALSTHLSRWSSQPSLHLHFLPRFWWTFNLLLPGLFLLLGMLLFSHVHQPVGFVSALFAVGGFMWSLGGHRLSHDCRWPNPALFGSLLSGMVYTGVCYFLAVLPNILLCPPLCLIFDTCILLKVTIALVGST